MNLRRGPIYGLFLGLARAGLLWEYLWPALWPATALVGIFCAAALFDVFNYMPIWAHAAVVVIFLIGLMAALQRALTRIPRINQIQARHRIEENSGMEHRPLAALDDKLAAGFDDPQALSLWRAHQQRMAEEAENLSLKWPQAGLSRKDPWGLRAAVAMVLVIGVIAAGADGFSRLSRALIPELSALAIGGDTKLTIWITPPVYTRLPPIVLRRGGQLGGQLEGRDTNAKTIEAPLGSTILAQVTGGGEVPNLVIGGSDQKFSRVEADAYHLETELGDGDQLTIVQRGRSIASWPLKVIHDTAPTIKFSAAPETGRQLRLQLPYEAADDYGLTGITASIRRLDGKAIAGGEDEIIVRLYLPGTDHRSIKGKSNHDLISHVWAGLPVLVHLLATDEKGQIGLSGVEPVVLPERQFSHPVAIELYELRKQLTADIRDRRLAILKLDSIAEKPSAFDGNKTIYLSLRVARERLRQDKSDKAVRQVQKMMWDAALSLEEGLTANANRDLRSAQRRLREALERGADMAELERLMDEVQKALERYMSSLMRELQQRGQLSPLDPNGQTMTMQDMQSMLDRARELMRQGSRDAARQLMAELQRMLDSLRRGLARNGRGDQQTREAQRTMRELRDIIRRQQKLLDETFRQSQKNRGQEPNNEDDEQKDQARLGAAEQKEIRRRLGELMKKFSNRGNGKIPKGLGDAERSMQLSERALGRGKAGESIDPQNNALEALRRGARNSARALARRLGRGRGNGPGRFGQFGGRFGMFTGPRLRGLRPGNRDPFGRQLEEGNSGTATGDVKIPGAKELKRAREILDELRRRAGDLWRPDLELEYIERLLKRF